MTIPGTPEGVEIVRIGIAGPDEFELIGDHIEKGKREGSISQVIVKPAPGWAFRFDIVSYELKPYKLLDAPVEVTYEIKFKFTGANDQQRVEAAFTKMVEGWADVGFQSWGKKP